jgi:hypothetical protein
MSQNSQSLVDVINKFKNGKELYNTSPLFNSIINTILQGNSLYKIIEDLCEMIFELNQKFSEQLTQKPNIKILALGQKVYHKEIYSGRELMEIVGIRKNEVELEGDYSGGTHNVIQRDWLPIEGVLFQYNNI